MISLTPTKEKGLFREGYIVAGVDEVGCGALAGPVIAAAVIVNIDECIDNIRDSKKVTSQSRKKLDAEIRQNAIAYAIGSASVQDIAKYNIRQASRLALLRAVQNLKVTPTIVLIDAYTIDSNILQESIKHGDSKIYSIAAASIIAKVYRDSLMQELSIEFPWYGFEKNSGYGTVQHREAIKQHGLTKYHRASFGAVQALIGG